MRLLAFFCLVVLRQLVAAEDARTGGLKLPSQRAVAYERPDEAFKSAFFDAIENDEGVEIQSADLNRKFSRRAANVVRSV
mmetsp:Transcript_57842/g.167578  ORF Transcript_57842/g.167578 Transcript_57842/m.167578 type:complete len:80 (+) Transcript_57842:107-346(+)